MTITENHKLTINLAREDELLEREEMTSYFKDYRRDDKLKLEPQLEKAVIARVKNVYPTADNFKIKIIDTNNLTVTVKFTNEI